jgi:Ca2+-binding EF-hand superfamily protein
MERDMLKRRAERMIQRFDTDNDGQVSQAEIDNHRQRMFARLDIDGSGAIEKDELPQPRGDRRGGEGRGEGRGDGYGFHRHGQFGRQ